MPQLDLVTFLTQYIWTLIILGSIFLLLVTTILPKIQQQLAIRSKVVEVEWGGIDTPRTSSRDWEGRIPPSPSPPSQPKAGIGIFQQLLTLKNSDSNK